MRTNKCLSAFAFSLFATVWESYRVISLRLGLWKIYSILNEINTQHTLVNSKYIVVFTNEKNQFVC